MTVIASAAGLGEVRHSPSLCRRPADERLRRGQQKRTLGDI
ncbi:hypothetical protein [Pseudomonas sp. BBP2017]|nr:hypothetical protein [Pseudomonas sp. BBP2017]